MLVARANIRACTAERVRAISLMIRAAVIGGVDGMCFFLGNGELLSRDREWEGGPWKNFRTVGAEEAR